MTDLTRLELFCSTCLLAHYDSDMYALNGSCLHTGCSSKRWKLFDSNASHLGVVYWPVTVLGDKNTIIAKSAKMTLVSANTDRDEQ